MNWPVFRLDDVSEVAAGNPAPQEPTDFADDGFPFIRMQDVGREHHTSNLRDSTDKVSSGAISRYRLRLFPTGSVLIPKSGASVNLNHRAMLGDDAYVVSHLAVVVPKREKLLPEYLYFWSLAYDPRSQAQTTSLPSLPLSLIKAAPIPVPPIPEQRRVVDILSRAEGIVRLRHEARKKAAEIIPALFLDMFGDPARNPKGWPQSSLKSVTTIIHRYPTFYGERYIDGGVPVVRISNITLEHDLNRDLSQYAKVDKSFSDKFPLTLLAARDLVMAVRGDTTGKLGLVPDVLVGANISPNLIRISPNSRQVTASYLLWYLLLSSQHVAAFITNTAKKSITAKNLKTVTVIVPPIALQDSFEQRVDSLRSISSQQAMAIQKAEATFEALLGKAFT